MAWQSRNGSRVPESQKMVQIDTLKLRDKLNMLYNSLRTSTNPVLDMESRRCFTRLWDLKEQALLSRKPSLEIPSSWLDDLESISVQNHAC